LKRSDRIQLQMLDKPLKETKAIQKVISIYHIFSTD